MNLLLDLVIAAGMLVVVPLGLALLDGVPGWLLPAWRAGAAAGAIALFLPRGAVAAVLAAGYAVATFAVAGWGVGRWWRRPRPLGRALARLTATASPAVAGVALVSERLGYPLFGFAPRILALTVAHFQFAGFTAALIAALTCASTRDSPLGTLAALCVPAGIVVVLVGFFAGTGVQLAGAVILTAGMWLVAGLTWREIRPGTTDRVTRALLGTAAAVLLATMALALSWALGRAVDLPHPSLDWMLATHGVANAFGFGLCSVLAWHRLRRGARTGPAAERSPQWRI